MSGMPECEGAIVKARAMSQACAATIETHARAKNGVQETGPDPGVSFGLDHAEVVLPGVRVQRHEAHAASAHAGDARQVNVTSALAREFDQRLGAQLLGHRRVQPDAFSGCEPACVGNRVGHRARSTRARSGADRAAFGQEFFAKGLLRLHEEGGKALPESAGTSRCSRTRATRWDRPRHLRLSARGGLAQYCRQGVVPGRLHYGREVTRPVIEHPRQRRSHSTTTGM